jgi:hypothetical protein
MSGTELKQPKPQLIDGMGRTIINLRISVTDRCNFRCTYCMPADNVDFMDRKELLSFEEITHIVQQTQITVTRACDVRVGFWPWHQDGRFRQEPHFTVTQHPPASQGAS